MVHSPRLLLALLTLTCVTACAPALDEQGMIDHGRYLIKLSGCNDCHTEEFMERGGDVPEREWLTGSRRGWHNETGTTYPTNLRLLISQISERQWLKMARTMRTQAPMAWYRLLDITDSDLRAIYRYVHWLGPAGNPAPPALPAGVQPPEPYIDFPSAH